MGITLPAKKISEGNLVAGSKFMRLDPIKLTYVVTPKTKVGTDIHVSGRDERE